MPSLPPSLPPSTCLTCLNVSVQSDNNRPKEAIKAYERALKCAKHLPQGPSQLRELEAVIKAQIKSHKDTGKRAPEETLAGLITSPMGPFGPGYDAFGDEFDDEFDGLGGGAGVGARGAGGGAASKKKRGGGTVAGGRVAKKAGAKKKRG